MNRWRSAAPALRRGAAALPFPPPGAPGARGLLASSATPDTHTTPRPPPANPQQTPGKRLTSTFQVAAPEPRPQDARSHEPQERRRDAPPDAPAQDPTPQPRPQRPAPRQSPQALEEKVWVCFNRRMRGPKRSVIPPTDLFYIQVTHLKKTNHFGHVFFTVNNYIYTRYKHCLI